MFVALVAVPPAALALFRNAEATQATVFSVSFAAAWFLVLWVVVRPQKVGGALLAQVVGLAVIVEPALAIALEEFFDPDTASVAQSVLAVGVPEELAGVGLGVPALLHGLNDWNPINGTVLWVVVQVISALLFLAYARIGLVAAPPAPRPAPPALPRPWGPPAAAMSAPAPERGDAASVSVPVPRVSGRHAAADEPVTAPIPLTPAMW